MGRGWFRGRTEELMQGKAAFPQAQGSGTGADQEHLVGKDGTLWEKGQPAQGRRREQDIIKQAAGITTEACCTEIIQSFQAILTQPIIIQIVIETNRHGRKFVLQWNDLHPESLKEWSDVDEIEVNAFI